MSSTGSVNSFDSELIRALLNSQLNPVSNSSAPVSQAISKILTNDKISSQLLILLNKLELSTDIISGLKQAFADISNVADDKLAKLTVPVEEDLKTPEGLKAALKEYDHTKIQKEIKQIKELIEKSPYISFRDKAAVEELEQSIRQVLKEIKKLLPETDSSPVKIKNQEIREFLKAATNEPLPSRKYASFEKALDKLSRSEEFKTQLNPSAKLLAVLHTVAERKEYNIENDLKLKEVIRQQIVSLKDLETTIKKLLISPSGESQLSTLIKVLDNIETEVSPLDTPIQIEFKKFIIELKNTLQELISASADENQIKDFLLKSLEKIYRDFKLEPIEIRLGENSKPEEIAEFLKPEQIVTLKLIESQIKLILNSPKESLFEQVKGSAPGEFNVIIKSEQLKVLLEQVDKFTKISELENTAIYKEAAKLSAGIKEIIKQTTLPEAAEKEVRKLISEFGSNNHKIISDILTKSENNYENKPDFKNQQNLKLIAELIKEVIKSELNIPDSNQAEEIVYNKIVSSSAYKSLIQLLKKTDQGLPLPQSAAQSEVLNVASDLLEKIETGRPANIVKLHEALTRSLDKIENKLLPVHTEIKELPLTSLNASAMRSLEGMAASQETLQKLNPVLNHLGEPTILLFPFAMQGILSKLEVSISGKRLESEEDKKRNKSGLRQNYQNIKFSLKLPALGNITVNIMHNDTELLASFSFENKKIEDKIKPMLSNLEVALRASGYEKVNLNTSSAAKAAEKVNWMSAILKNI